MADSTKPVIGITCSSGAKDSWARIYPGDVGNYLPGAYVRNVIAAGGVPLLLPINDDRACLKAALSRLDGLILSGGWDIIPRHYGEDSLTAIGTDCPNNDLLDLTVARLAREMDLPVLGICRGVQVLAVAFGGTLYQDIPTQIKDSLDHTQRIDLKAPAHRVKIVPGTLIHRIVGAEELWVNSVHHQAVKAVPDGFTVSARAADGVCEAIEDPDRRFFLGLQWHPEGDAAINPVSAAIFKALVEAAA